MPGLTKKKPRKKPSTGLRTVRIKPGPKARSARLGERKRSRKMNTMSAKERANLKMQKRGIRNSNI